MGYRDNSSLSGIVGVLILCTAVHMYRGVNHWTYQPTNSSVGICAQYCQGIMLVITVLPGHAPYSPYRAVHTSLSMTLSHADHYPSLSQLLTLPYGWVPHKSAPTSESTGFHPPLPLPSVATGYSFREGVTRGLWSLLIVMLPHTP